jgi:C4-dicarboxylate transporter DctQ subunit
VEGAGRRSAAPPRGILSLAGRLLDGIENLFAVLAGVLLLMGMVAVMFEVTSRFLANRSFAWVVEINEDVLIWVTFLGAAWVLRHGGHITVDLAESILPVRVLRFLDVLIALIGLAVSSVLVWFGWAVAERAFEQGRVSLTVSQLPEGPLLVIIPIGGALLGLEFIRQGYRAIVHGRTAFEDTHVERAE